MSDQGQQRRIDALVSRSARYLLLGVGPVVCLAVVYSDQIMGTWLGPDFVGESATAFRILAVGVLMNSLAAVPYSLIQALGRPDVTARIHLLELPVHIALVWGLVKIWGIPGAATAWSVRATMDAALLFIAASSLGGMPLSTLFTNRNLRTLLLLFALAIAATGIKAAAVVMWLDLTIWMSVLVGMSLAVWHFVLDEGERDEILGVIWASGRKWKQSA
jgi:O-antigen/teichoic acid export membrane protein